MRLGLPGLRGPRQGAERREGVLSWTPAPASAPERAPNRGDERLQERAERRRFGGSARPSVKPVAAGGAGKLGTLSTTHTLVGRFAQLTQALPARRGRLEEPHYRHTHTHASIRTYVNTDIPPAHQRPLGTVTSSESASVPARSAAPVAIDNHSKSGVMLGSARHRNTTSCLHVRIRLPRFAK